MSVSKLKQDLAQLVSRGRAGCVAGVIVSEHMWERLKADFDGEFAGRISISGVQGNRKIRYEFYILKSPAFLKDRFPGGYFLIPFSEEDYRERILGHEMEDLVQRSESLYGWSFTEINPLEGLVFASHPDLIQAWIENVDFSRLLEFIRAQSTNYRDVHKYVCDFSHRGMTVRGPDEIVWLKHPERYDYHRADLKKSVGHLLMRRAEVDGAIFFDILGIAINGRKQVVEILEPTMRYTDLNEFVKRAKWYFLPEEITDFLTQFGIRVDPKDLELDPLYEAWGYQMDPEAIGRLTQWISNSKTNGPWDLHTVSGNFVGSRDVEYTLRLCDRVQGSEWEKLEAEHYPPGWKGWPDTSHDKAWQSFARAFLNT
jgi:hypothetical protein